ncbi:polyketide synthase type I [Saccharothrix sp. ALI-22-I]|uniref:thioester reductase domain-containing protein n=1 Tax=Saccharothrix sp. ALI-22-I TaxID=1933778 RepID=UPI00097CAB4E|nr:thioester reductase domain-containing protein [Saccharothrix sp. ALI-22-I]ONI91075.1 polyketide synthase type I [Saccharothrix sp. ALI-22-I]
MSADLDIAVVGVGCRFPDAVTPEQYWANIDRGLVSMRELTDAQLREAGVPDERIARSDYVRIGTSLPGVADFAAEFFGYTPREARGMDPQQRLFLENAWEALESAGHPPRPDGPVVGVFAGSAAGTYSTALLAAAVRRVGLADAVDDLDLTLGGEPDFLTSRTAYKLGLRGPAVSVQTACSSALYAVHYASLSLLSGECDIALAGGATVLEPVRGYRYRPDGGQSDDGYCRSFDARSTGTTYSSGVGVVALRRLSDALADGDPVLAVLKGTAVGNDGNAKAGFAAPSPDGVAAVVSAALRVSGVPADALRYVEAHGTATPLGDHVELSALTEALRRTTEKMGFCGLGSVKANIGHTGPASSIAGFIKAVHIARTGQLPPHPTYERPRDAALLESSPFFITTTGRTCTDADRHVLVDSIGMGGANAAAVLGPPPQPVRPSAPSSDRVRLVLSARTRVELDRLSKALADTVDRGAHLGDVAHTLRVGRHSFAERRVVDAPADKLAAALRLPRPPFARTARAAERGALVVAPDGVEPPKALLAALPADTEVVSTDDGAGERYRVVVDADADADAALAVAWLHGVPVDWAAVDGGRGRRVALPTYPFDRKRHWALDDLALDESAPAPPAGSADSVEEQVLAVWRELFGDDSLGPDAEFGDCGGTSLLSVQLVLELQDRFDVLVNVHRAGGTRATPHRVAALVRGLLTSADDQPRVDRMDEDDNGLVDADLQLPLGPVNPVATRGRDVLLTGATGYLGAFLLHELQQRTTGRVYCLVRADDEAAAMARLRAGARRFLLPEPDADRVVAVPGDLKDIERVGADFRGGELGARVGHVLHCAARVVFTEPYRTLREDNVLPMVSLLTWARAHGIRDFSHVSTAAATAPAPGADRILEIREQPLDPRLGGYGVTKWVAERLLDRADLDGMRVRVFRPGLIMSSSQTGAGNNRDLIYFVLAAGVAVGAHPVDDRSHDFAPVDVVARAIVELGMSRGSVGRAYHLVGETLLGLREMFGLLAEAGLPTTPLPLDRWQQLVRERAKATGNPLLSTAALLELEGNEPGAPPVQAAGWLPWLRRTGMDPALTGPTLRAGLTYLARTDELFGALLPELAADTAVLVGEGR